MVLLASLALYGTDPNFNLTGSRGGEDERPSATPIKLAGIVLLVIAALVFTFIYLQFRGTLTPKTKLTMISSRAGLVMDPGAKVTYNGSRSDASPMSCRSAETASRWRSSTSRSNPATSR